ncbi:zinc-binding dehydrogenase [Sinomonas sp. G460-2]|uniref:zinc-binding dehydrogenase n=1 Tax=Sinomonas sp. G460-2 TaxID=3393464 RepID=UPI0039EF9EE7
MFNGERTLEIRDFPDPSPGPQDVIIEIRASGMCGSDLHHYRGPRETAPTVIVGHEPAGVIVEAGAEVPASWIGRSVMVHHYFGCGRCDQCHAGWPQLCREGLQAMGHHVNGSHASFARVPFRAVLPMPEGLSFLASAAISCGSGTAWGALERIDLRGSDTIVIFGQGPVGLAATQLASAMGARVIALDIEPHRLERAREFGAAEVINPTEAESVRDAVLELTNGRGASKSLETSGSPIAVNQALEVLGLWGVACWVGRGSRAQVDLSDHLWSQITAKTSWTMSVQSMTRPADLVVERGIEVDALFTHRWKLSDAAQAYKVLDTQSTGKGVLLP